MYFFESIGSSFQNIFTHKLRSFLTLLGIIIGVFAVVTMFSTVYGLKTMINEKMEEMGWNNSIIVYPSSSETRFSRRRLRFRYINRETKPITFSDYTMLKNDVSSRYIYGYISSYEKFFINDKQENVHLKATNNEFFLSKTYKLKIGRYFNQYEESNAIKVCVIGFYFAEKYFDERKALENIITIGGNRYKIIGVLNKDELNQSGMNFNKWERHNDLEAVYIPLSTGARYLRSDNAIDYIYLQATNDKTFAEMKTGTWQKLLANHKMAHDFSFNDVGALLFKITEEINEMMKKWNITLSAIASISLIVGGIGLFSTLLISINERMMEIGIRKSIGATDKDIFILFLAESIVLALIGAFIGIFFSSFLVKALTMALKSRFAMPVEGVLIGIAFSVFIGVISGIYPAIKASRIDPIKAIYYFE